MAEYEFQGHDYTVYPGHQHPEKAGVLQAEPGEVIDFGQAAPPGDLLWYDRASGEVYEPSQDVEGAEPAQGDAEPDKAEED